MFENKLNRFSEQATTEVERFKKNINRAIDEVIEKLCIYNIDDREKLHSLRARLNRAEKMLDLPLSNASRSYRIGAAINTLIENDRYE